MSPASCRRLTALAGPGVTVTGIATGKEDVLADKDLPTVAAADAAIVCIGLNGDMEAESWDRKYELPAGQLALLTAVAKANRHTVVVLNVGGSMQFNPWIDQVPAPAAMPGIPARKAAKPSPKSSSATPIPPAGFHLHREAHGRHARLRQLARPAAKSNTRKA